MEKNIKETKTIEESKKDRFSSDALLRAFILDRISENKEQKKQ